MSAPDSGPASDGGPAFPVPVGVTFNHIDGDISDEGFGGMSLRDYFAAEIMNGKLAHGSTFVDDETLAQRVYLLADAMLKARGQKP